MSWALRESDEILELGDTPMKGQGLSEKDTFGSGSESGDDADGQQIGIDGHEQDMNPGDIVADRQDVESGGTESHKQDMGPADIGEDTQVANPDGTVEETQLDDTHGVIPDEPEAALAVPQAALGRMSKTDVDDCIARSAFHDLF